MIESNKIYRSQYALLALIASLTFKLVMLPQYISRYAQNNAYFVIMVMMAIEVAMYLMVTYSSSRFNLLEEKNVWLKAPIFIAVFLLSGFKLLVMFSETITYTSSVLFDQGKIYFIILAFVPVLAYIVHKGATNLGRLAQIIFWFIVATVAFMLLFTRIELDWGNLMPFLPDGGYGALEAGTKHFLWFGDYLPFLFFYIISDDKKINGKSSVPIILIVLYILIVAFYLLFNLIYSNTGLYIDFAFSKIAVFNKISQLIGSTNFPVILTWILMSIVKLSLLLYTMTVTLTYFVKKKWIALTINSVGISIILMFFLTNVEQTYSLATNKISYLIGAVQYAVPIIILIYAKVKYGKKNSKT